MLKEEKEREENKNKQSLKNYKEDIGTQLIKNIKKLKLKIHSRLCNFKNTMLKKRKKEKKTTRSPKLHKIYI